jgi:hypothetical protein
MGHNFLGARLALAALLLLCDFDGGRVVEGDSIAGLSLTNTDPGGVG